MVCEDGKCTSPCKGYQCPYKPGPSDEIKCAEEGEIVKESYHESSAKHLCVRGKLIKCESGMKDKIFETSDGRVFYCEGWGVWKEVTDCVKNKKAKISQISVECKNIINENNVEVGYAFVDGTTSWGHECTSLSGTIACKAIWEHGEGSWSRDTKMPGGIGKTTLMLWDVPCSGEKFTNDLTIKCKFTWDKYVLDESTVKIKKGEKSVRSSLSLPYKIYWVNLERGWNLIGFPFTPERIRVEGEGCNIYPKIFHWNGKSWNIHTGENCRMIVEGDNVLPVRITLQKGWNQVAGGADIDSKNCRNLKLFGFVDDQWNVENNLQDLGFMNGYFIKCE